MVAGRCWLGRVSSPKSTCWHGSLPRTCASRASETGHAKPASSPRTGHATWHTRTSASRGDSCKTSSPPWWTWSGVTRWSSLLCPSCAAGCSLPWCGGWWLLPTATWTLAQRALQTAQSGRRAWRVSGKVRSVGWRKGGNQSCLLSCRCLKCSFCFTWTVAFGWDGWKVQCFPLDYVNSASLLGLENTVL